MINLFHLGVTTGFTIQFFTNLEGGEKYLGKLSDNTELSCVFKGVEHLNNVLMLELPQYLKAYKKILGDTT